MEECVSIRFPKFTGNRHDFFSCRHHTIIWMSDLVFGQKNSTFFFVNSFSCEAHRDHPVLFSALFCCSICFHFILFFSFSFRLNKRRESNENKKKEDFSEMDSIKWYVYFVFAYASSCWTMHTYSRRAIITQAEETSSFTHCKHIP